MSSLPNRPKGESRLRSEVDWPRGVEEARKGESYLTASDSWLASDQTVVTSVLTGRESRSKERGRPASEGEDRERERACGRKGDREESSQKSSESSREEAEGSRERASEIARGGRRPLLRWLLTTRARRAKSWGDRGMAATTCESRATCFSRGQRDVDPNKYLKCPQSLGTFVDVIQGAYSTAFARAPRFRFLLSCALCCGLGEGLSDLSLMTYQNFCFPSALCF
ncbi:hypothetical protein KFK09_009604 [Dendrobium nobile]|uniref:Uncharacterized protein n=1 Tax=Dendrobium nobile TaxID=94219 RepID=A0A8T3BK90_DENNO|nr:hypothetical protein KFK09_009604 [Dendrobium nobile]